MVPGAIRQLLREGDVAAARARAAALNARLQINDRDRAIPTQALPTRSLLLLRDLTTWLQPFSGGPLACPDRIAAYQHVPRAALVALAIARDALCCGAEARMCPARGTAFGARPARASVPFASRVACLAAQRAGQRAGRRIVGALYTALERAHDSKRSLARRNSLPRRTNRKHTQDAQSEGQGS